MQSTQSILTNFLVPRGRRRKGVITALSATFPDAGKKEGHRGLGWGLTAAIQCELSGRSASATLSRISRRGEVSERLKEPASKAGSLAKPGSWVRIPPSPPRIVWCVAAIHPYRLWLFHSD
jgi:hypothetical protein